MKEEIGTYRKNQKGFGFVKLEGQEEEIYISKENSYNALNGDTVAIKIISEKEADKKAEGKIVKIVRHEKDTVVGTFQKNRNFGFVVPDDKNFGTDIFISKSHWGKARNNHKVLVKIIKYPEKGKNAEGEIIEILGGVNEAGVDMLSLIRQYELPYKFPEEVVSEAKAFGNKINEKNLEGRRDLRQDIIFTIDGEDAKDLDDAIHVEKLTNGNYRLDVHIADVSNYVREKTELDKEAYLRGTSIYMLGRVIPMLPRELSNGICSLNAGEDRFTLSCSMEITPKAKVVSSDIYKAVIRVTERMSYTDVQKILDRSDEKILKRYEKYISHFDLMAELANILKDKRRENGYLNLDIPESKIILDENGYAIDVKKYETYFANEIIEQFMLIANETVAERFYWLQAPFIYRNHEAPDLDKVKDLNKTLYNFGYKIKISKEEIIYPDKNRDPEEYLSVYYSVPQWLVKRWVQTYGTETTECMLKDFLTDHPLTIRCQLYRVEQELTVNSLKGQGATVEQAPYLPYAFYLSDYSHLEGLKSFVMGRFVVQDVSSMLVTEAADPKPGDYVIDLCAAPGGKSLHMADKMQGQGMVDARDLTDYKVGLIEENIERTQTLNIRAHRKDATLLDKESVEKADIVLADVPCSGLGVIGKKTDIKYRTDEDKIQELAVLQKQILHNAASYVKPGGILIYSTCTITSEENQSNVAWFTENYPFVLESLDPYLCEELHSETTAQGWLQLLPGVHKTDGFFLARMRKK